MFNLFKKEPEITYVMDTRNPSYKFMNNLYEMAVKLYGLEHGACEFEVETALGKRIIKIRKNQKLNERIFFHYFNPDEGKEIMYLTLLPIEGIETAEFEISPQSAFLALFELEGIVFEKYNFKEAKITALDSLISGQQRTLDKTKRTIKEFREALDKVLE